MLNLHGFIGIASIDDNGDCDDFGLHLLLTTIVALFRAVSRVVVVIVDGDVCGSIFDIAVVYIGGCMPHGNATGC